MAQLPPKIPNMSPHHWPDFSSQKLPSLAAAGQNPSWVDDFLDFSAARRGSHRRSISDSIAFLEAPVSVSGHHNHHPSFDRFDDDQFISMFSDDPPDNDNNNVGSSSNTSSPSDHNSVNDETKEPPSDYHRKDMTHHIGGSGGEAEEVQSQCKTEPQEVPPLNSDSTLNSGNRIFDPKRVKRILANRQSAQRSRVRKLQYISELERSVTSLQAEVSELSPRVAFLDHQRLLLNVDNSALKQRIAALAQDKIFKDAHQEALKREIERLRTVYHQQKTKKMENACQSPAAADVKPSGETEQLLNALN
ncbi:PREDICTED: basic leucine zipper 61-like [Tarenaya hassleriana]|uniref:basic leucine zipper 61-like n=1 Tax=Tarenaya hassleriana TaxID=28532 RepID=UPI00053C0F65|nr:PREDICTED: basic leucine zipper 61-like [Tarenaya hassleriana]